MERPFLRARAFFVAAASLFGRSVGRERHVTEGIGALPRNFKGTGQDLASRERSDKRRKKYTARTPRLDRVGPERLA